MATEHLSAFPMVTAARNPHNGVRARRPKSIAMRTLTDHLRQYAAYHRDRRNIVTHFAGIPMIVHRSSRARARRARAGPDPRRRVEPLGGWPAQPCHKTGVVHV